MNVLTHGCTQVMVERFDPLVVLASIHKERCTAVYGVPTMFIAELHHPMFDMFDLTSLRTGIMAGSLCPVELNEAGARENVYEGYQRLRSYRNVARYDSNPNRRFFEARCNTVGYEFEFTEVKVLDPETGEECPGWCSG